jgi:hypothetical protein
MLHDDDLSSESLTSFSRVLFGIRGDRSSGDILNGESFDVETNVVSWISSLELGMMLLNRFDFSLDSRWSKLAHHSWLDDSGLNSSDWNSSDSGDLIDIL